MVTSYTDGSPNAIINTAKKPKIITWTLTDGQSGDVYPWCAGFNDKSVHVYGTLGGATVTIKGGNVNDATKLVTLKDFDGNAITFISGDVNSVRDHISCIQPVVTGGSGSAIVIAILME